MVNRWWSRRLPPCRRILTFLLRAGEEPRRVPEHQQLFLRIGDVIDIGDGTTLTVERKA